MKAYQLKVTLIDAEPVIWRRFVIPAGTNFQRLHDTIQFAMGWQEAHLFQFEVEEESLQISGDHEAVDEHQFYLKEFKGKVLTEEEDPYRYISKKLQYNMRKAKNVKIDQFLDKYKSITYIYDFGDNWEHLIEVEAVIENYPVGHPTLIDAEGACPPEDVGGVYGYREFLMAWKDPKHSEHEHMREWAESQGYKETIDMKLINRWMEEFLRLKKI